MTELRLVAESEEYEMVHNLQELEQLNPNTPLLTAADGLCHAADITYDLRRSADTFNLNVFPATILVKKIRETPSN